MKIEELENKIKEFEEIEKAIQILEGMKDGYTFKDCETCFSNITGKGCIGKNKCEYIKAIDIILKEFEEKEKVIDAMADYLYGGTDMPTSFNSKEKVRNFFEDKV